MIFEALGIPMKWSKYRGGFAFDWIGYEIDFENWTLGISESRARWVREWLEARLAEMTVDLEDLCAVLGRLSFAMGPHRPSEAFRGADLRVVGGGRPERADAPPLVDGLSLQGHPGELGRRRPLRGDAPRDGESR